jgi:uncharacterized protein (UPF0548 family)
MSVRAWIVKLFGGKPSALAARPRGKNRKGPRARPSLEVLEDRALPSTVNFAPAMNFAAGSTPFSVAVGDFNGDGKPDLAVANTFGSNVSVLLGNGDGSLQSAVNYATGPRPNSVAVGDFNGDGKQDLAVANRGDPRVGGDAVSVLLGNGDGTFQNAVNYAAGSAPFSVAVGDFNGDGKQDLAVANASSGNVSVLLGSGKGTFQNAVNYSTGLAPYSVAVGEFNGDGKQDLAVATFLGDVSVLLGNGNGTFQNAVNYAAGVDIRSVAVGDFNGDGKQDLVVANSNSANISVLLGNGDGSFASAVNYATGPGPFSVAVGDFNGDGKQDLAVANSNSANVSVLLGNGDGTFQSAVNYNANNGPVSVAVGDFNGDGKLDLATANASTFNDVSVLLNTTAPGSLQFSAATFSAAEGGSATITVTRTGGSDGTVTVQVATSGGNATAGADFIDAAQTLTFADGETSRSFTIPIRTDNLVEGNETVNLTLSSPTGGATLGTPSTAVLTITDVPPPPVVDVPPPPPVMQARGLVASLVQWKVGRRQRLFVRVSYADTGAVKAWFRSPFQRPAFRNIAAVAVDSNGDGVADAVLLAARKGLLTARKTVWYLLPV